MARWPRTLVIEFTDGQVRRVEQVTQYSVRNGVLHLEDDSRSHFGVIEERGAFPIGNIRSFDWEER